MRYVAFIALLVAATLAVVIVVSSDDDGGDYKVRAIFENAGFVIPGEDVKVAGVKVGKIDEIQYRGGEVNPVTHKREPLVRVKVSIEKRYQQAVRDNSIFYVTTQGVLGEQFLQICLLYTSPSPRDRQKSRMPSSA